MSNLETGARSKEKSAVSPREKNRVFRLEMKPFQFPMRDPLFAIHALYTLAFSLSRRVGKGAGAWAWTGRRARKIGGFLVGAEVTGFSTSRTDEEIRDLSRTFNAGEMKRFVRRRRWNNWYALHASRCVGKFYFCFSWSRLNHIELLLRRREKEG